MISSPVTTIKQIPLHATASSNITVRTPTVQHQTTQLYMPRRGFSSPHFLLRSIKSPPFKSLNPVHIIRSFYAYQ
jgi:hypothetical protein